MPNILSNNTFIINKKAWNEKKNCCGDISTAISKRYLLKFF